MSIESDSRIAQVSDELADFIIKELDWDGTKSDLLADEPVELPAILDSSDLFELAGFLEDSYGIEISDEEIVAQTFATVKLLAETVVTKQAILSAG